MSFFKTRCQTIMLKNLLVRKRHWLMTIFEILCPLALFALLTYTRNKSAISQKGSEQPMTFNDHMSETEIFNHTSILQYTANYEVHMGYTPVTPFTTNFMQMFNNTPYFNRLIVTKNLGKY